LSEDVRPSLKEKDKLSLAFGGQAVLEGIMIRSQEFMVISVRIPNGEILTKKEKLDLISEKNRILRFPFIRGIIKLFETLKLGFKSLFWSANVALEEEGESFTNKDIAITISITLALASLFIIIPFLLTTFLKIKGVVFNITEAFFRLSFFLVYLKLVSSWGDFKRVLQYHGAEHMIINTYETGIIPNLTNVKKASRLHPRCGTSFIFIVMLISILLFSVMPETGFFIRLAYRIILIPVIVAISYELLKLSDKYKNSKIFKLLISPNIALQRLTTKEPDEDMLEVALTAVNKVIKKNFSDVQS
jgi:uncharacterized protein YqhQ